MAREVPCYVCGVPGRTRGRGYNMAWMHADRVDSTTKLVPVCDSCRVHLDYISPEAGNVWIAKQRRQRRARG